LANKKELNNDYYSYFRAPLTAMIRGKPRSVLELGCGSGLTLAYCKQAFDCQQVVGIELDEAAGVVASTRPEIDKVLQGNIENNTFDLAPDSFDLLIASHVLEHMSDPWKVLAQFIRWARKDAQILIALPNARHLSLTLPLLLKGNFDYEASGIRDRTHLRFFTRSSMLALVEKAGLELDIIQPDHGARMKPWNSCTLGLFSDHLAYAYNISCTRR
jgi:SAM-dependent methyltransferase